MGNRQRQLTIEQLDRAFELTREEEELIAEELKKVKEEYTTLEHLQEWIRNLEAEIGRIIDEIKKGRINKEQARQRVTAVENELKKFEGFLKKLSGQERALIRLSRPLKGYIVHLRSRLAIAMRRRNFAGIDEFEEGTGAFEG